MTRDRVVTLLAKLDALAANPGTAAEGDAARRRASAIREKHADMLAQPQPVAAAPGYATQGFVWPGAAADTIVWNGIQVVMGAGVRVEFR